MLVGRAWAGVGGGAGGHARRAVAGGSGGTGCVVAGCSWRGGPGGPSPVAVGAVVGVGKWGELHH